MTTPTKQITTTIGICLNNLHKTIYAESAWRLATHITDGSDSPLLNADRQRLTDEFIATAFADTISWLSAYASTHNLSTFRTDGMLSLELSYRSHVCSSTSHHQSLGTIIAQAITARVLNLCYPSDVCYASRYQKLRNATLTALALHEQ